MLHNPNPKAFALINTGEVTSNGEHWMGVVINKLTNNSGYFDSFCRRFDWLEEVLKRNFLSMHKTNHIVQSESTQTCGLHTIYFIIRMMDPKEKTLTNQNVNMGEYVRKHFDIKSSNECLKQFGTQVKFCWSRDHNNWTAENAFSTPWYYSEMELEPVSG